MHELLAIVRQLSTADALPARLASLVQVEGSSYRRPGARLLVTAAGTRIGSISGGCLEEDLVAQMQRLGPTHPFSMTVYDTTSENDLVWGVGTGCHGRVHLALEYVAAPPRWAQTAAAALAARRPVDLVIRCDGPRAGTDLTDHSEPTEGASYREQLLPPLHLVVAGAGDDAQPLVRLAQVIGWTVTVIDPRPAFATAERFPSAEQVLCLPPEEVAAAVSWDARTPAVIMTHHYRFDLPFLAGLLPLSLPYLGLLGPRRRAERLLADLAAQGQVPPAPHADVLHAPVGLDLGGDGPEAVALAIVAEIQARFCQRSAQPLRLRERGIHAS